MKVKTVAEKIIAPEEPSSDSEDDDKDAKGFQLQDFFTHPNL